MDENASCLGKEAKAQNIMFSNVRIGGYEYSLQHFLLPEIYMIAPFVLPFELPEKMKKKS